MPTAMGQLAGNTSVVKVTCVIIGGILIHLTIGSLYTFGNISPYMISYLRDRTPDTSVTNVDSLWINVVGSTCSFMGMTLGGVMDRRFGTRVTAAIGCVIYSGGVLATYFTIKRSLFLVTLTYGLLTNFGQSIAYGPTAQNAVMWMPKRPTLAVGIILCGFGGGALIFNQVITAYVNPDNISPDLKTPDGEKYFTDADLLDKVPLLFLVLGACYIPMEIIGCCLTFSPRSGQSILNEQSEDDAKPLQPVKTVIWNMLHNRNSYIIWVLVFCIHSGMQFAIGLYKAYGQTFISDDHFLALVGSISSIFNCLCRPMWGIIMDKYGFEITTKLIATGFVIFNCTLLLTEYMPKELFLVWICALFVFFCGIWPVCPATYAKLFGARNMAINMGFMFSAASLASILGNIVGLSVKDLIGWHGLFMLSGILGCIAFFVTFFFNGVDEKGKKI